MNSDKISTTSGKIIINAETIRQYLYCKRVIYFREVSKVKGTRSYLVKKGSSYHKRKQKEKYEFVGDLKSFRNKYFQSKLFGIGAKIDLLRVREKELIPVEFKRFQTSLKTPSKSHIHQLIAGAIAAEEELGINCNRVQIRYWRGNKAEIEITDETKLQTIGFAEEIRNMIKTGRIPEPTKAKNKCVNCEFMKICQNEI